MAKPFYNEEVATIGEETLRLVINFRAIDAIESLLGDFDEVLLRFLGRGKVSRATQAKFLWGLLREHHGDLTLDQAVGLTYGPGGEKIGGAIGRLIAAAFNLTEAKKETDENPPEPRGA